MLKWTGSQDEKKTHLGVTNDVPVVIEHVEADDRTLHLRAAELRVTVNLHDRGSVGVPQGSQGSVGVMSQGKRVLPDALHPTSEQQTGVKGKHERDGKFSLSFKKMRSL